jgi:DeoR/GlpR family transcriptional regulator of sugar metabolism
VIILLAPERYKIILAEIEENGHVSIVNLKRLLGVSMDTIRRDLEHLEKTNKLNRVHGGAVSIDEGVTNQVFKKRKIVNIERKQEIAAVAADLLEENMAISMNAGTTNIELAKILAARFEKLTIITNCLKEAEILAEKRDFTIIIPGGTLNNEEFSLYGPSVEQEICRYNIDIAFISINAISIEKGLTDFRQGESAVITAMIKAAKRTVVVADSSKFETTSYINVCELNKIDAIVTDTAMENQIRALYEQQNIEIIQRLL